MSFATVAQRCSKWGASPYSTSVYVATYQKSAPVPSSLSSNLVIKAQERGDFPYVSKKNRGNIWRFCRSRCRNLSQSTFLYATPFFNHKITFNHVYTAEPACYSKESLAGAQLSVIALAVSRMESASPQQSLQGCALAWQWKGLVAHRCFGTAEQHWHSISNVSPTFCSPPPAGWGWTKGWEGTQPGQLSPADQGVHATWHDVQQ